MFRVQALACDRYLLFDVWRRLGLHPPAKRVSNPTNCVGGIRSQNVQLQRSGEAWTLNLAIRRANVMANKTERTNIMDLFALDGRRALIPGGAKGLGGVIAQALAEAGADVAVASRNLPECRAAAGEIAESTGRRAVGFEADVTS